MKRILSLSIVALFFFTIIVSTWAFSQIDSIKTNFLEEETKEDVYLSLSSNSLKQGEIFVIKIEGKKPLPSTLIALLGTTKGIFFTYQDGSNSDFYTKEAVMGIPADMKPGKYTLKVLSDSNNKIAEASINVINGKFRRQNISVSKSTKAIRPSPGELEAIQALKASASNIRYWAKPFVSPTPDCENSPFGVKRYHNGVYTNDYHKGVDLRSPLGRPVKAITGGMVKIATTSFRLHGSTVGLDHGHGLTSVYIHLSKITVKEGDIVKKGDVIGNVGSTGFATGPHLHWGLYANGVPVNADFWIPVSHC